VSGSAGVEPGEIDGADAPDVGGERAVMSLPAAVRQRFWGYAESELLDPAHRDHLIARLMEQANGAELRWLVRACGRDALASLLARRGGRALSRRSRAFWERVLGVRGAPPQPLAHEIWPLA